MKWVSARQDPKGVSDFKITKTYRTGWSNPDESVLNWAQRDCFGKKTNPSSWNLIFESLFVWNFMSGNSSKIFGSNPCPLYGFIWPISWSPQWLARSSKSFSLCEQQLQIALIKLEREHKNQRKQAHDTVPSDTIRIRYIMSADDGQVPGKFFP